MKFLFPLAVVFVANLVLTTQEELQRNLPKLAPLIGGWNMHVRTYEPREVRIVGDGSVVAKWALNKRHVELIANLRIEGKGNWEGRGFVTFDDDSPKPAFRGYFFWGDDGRMLPMNGQFVNGKLVLEGAPLILEHRKQSTIRTTVAFTSKARIDISLDFRDGTKLAHLGEIVLTKQ